MTTLNTHSPALAIDIGTNSVRAAVVDSLGRILGIAVRNLELHRDEQTGFIEQDGMDIVNKTREVIAEVTNGPIAMARAGLAIQRSTVIAWDPANGQPLYPAISWQDTRAMEFVSTLHDNSRQIQALSGLVLSPHYGASKIRWLAKKLQDNPQNTLQVEDSPRRGICIAPLVSFVLFHLLDRQLYLCDESNAARTQLWDLSSRCWSESLCALFDVDIDNLPTVRPVVGDYGKISNTEISLTAVCGDQNAAYRAQRKLIAKRQGDTAEVAVVNLGTGAFILAETETGIEPGALLKSLAFSDEQGCQYLLEATVNGAGSALEWAYESWRAEKLMAGTEEISDRKYFFSHLNGWWLTYTDPPLFVNAVGGVGSPFWYSHLQSVFLEEEPSAVGWEAKTVAVLESILFLLVINLDNMKSVGKRLKYLYCSGGLSKVEIFCRKLANLSGMEVVRVEQAEATLAGVAILAQNGDAGGQASDAGAYDVFTPTPDRADVELRERYTKFKRYMESIAS